MATFFDAAIIFCLIGQMGLCFIIYFRLESIVELIEESNIYRSEKLNELYRTMLDLRETLDTTKPIKPNNWDSIKEAFRGPTRVGNERD